MAAIPQLYFDANSLHFYRSQRPNHAEKLNALFQHSETGTILCVTSTYTRLEMLNFAKRAAYAVQELEGGRVDLDKILEESRRALRVQSARLTTTREELDRWFEDQAAAGRLQLKNLSGRADVWRLAEILMEQTSIAGNSDCIQVATAILLGCSVFVTEDQQLRWCVEQELLAAGESRRRVEDALVALTGAADLSLQALNIHDAHVLVERHVRGLP